MVSVQLNHCASLPLMPTKIRLTYAAQQPDEQAVTTVVCIGKTHASRVGTLTPHRQRPPTSARKQNTATGVQAIHSNMLFLAVDEAPYTRPIANLAM
jgi:hypothetical protein